MLKLFRENLKSFHWVLWVVIIVFVLLEFVGGGGIGGPTSGRAAKAAWAGDTQVTFAEFENTYRQKEAQYQQAFQGNLPDEFRERLKIEALDDALNRKLMIQEARDLGLTVREEELRKEILDFPYFQKEDGSFVGSEEYQQRMRRLGYSTSKEFEQTVRDDMIHRKLSNLLRESAFVTDSSVEKAYREQVERAKVRYLVLPSQQVASEVQATQAELASYFAENQETYRLPEQRKIGYVLVDNALLRSKIEVTQEDLQAYYDANAADYQQEEQVRARHILLKTDERTPEDAVAQLNGYRQRIEAGESFEDLAKEFSEDPGSARNGGDLRFFGRGRMVPEFEQAAFGAKVGDLAGPIVSAFGAHLLEVTGRREAGQRPLDEVQAQVRHKLLTERVEEQGKVFAGDVLSGLQGGDSSVAAQERLSQIAEELDYASFAVTNAFGREDLIPGIGRSADFSSAAFDLEPEGISEPVKVPRGWAILTLSEELEPRLPELSEVTETVRQAVLQEKQKARAGEKLQEARQALDGGETLDAVAEGLGLEVKESQDLGRNGSIPELGTASAKVVELALSLDEGQLGGPIDYPQGAALFQVSARTRMDAEEFENQKEATRQNLENQAYQQLQMSVLNQRRRDLNTQYAPEIVQSLGDSGAAQ